MADSIKSGMHVFSLSRGVLPNYVHSVRRRCRQRAWIRESTTTRGVIVVPPREATSAQRGVLPVGPELSIAYPEGPHWCVNAVAVDRGSADRHIVQVDRVSASSTDG